MECGEEILGWRGELKAGYTFSRNSPELWVLVLSARATLTHSSERCQPENAAPFA